MDVGNPSNFVRLLSIYHNKISLMRRDIIGISVSDAATRATIASVYKHYGYVADPHTAVGLAAAEEYRQARRPAGPVVVLATAHPAKFREIVEPVIGRRLKLPSQLQEAMRRKKRSVII